MTGIFNLFSSVYSVVFSDYGVHLAILICIYLILAQSFNLTFGLGQLFNLAHIAIYAIGAYTTAILSVDFGFSFLRCAALSALLGGFLALLIGMISLRLAQDYFAIGSLAFNSVIVALLINLKSVTGGVLGIPGIPRPEFGAIDFNQNSNFLILSSILVVFSFVVLFFLFNSPFARTLRAQSEHEMAAQSIGKAIARNRIWAFFVSSLFAGLAGSLFAYYMNYIDPSSFNLGEMILVLTMVILGKPGSFWGVAAATIFLVLLPEPLRFIDIPPSVLGPVRQMMYAGILFAVVYIRRADIFPHKRVV